MTETGFFARKRQSPASLGLVLLLHAGVIGGVVMIKAPQFIPIDFGRTEVRLIPIDPDPPQVPPPPQPQPQQPRTQIAQIEPIVRTDASTQVVNTVRNPPVIPVTAVAGTAITPPFIPDPPPAPVRRAAEMDPRFANLLQPPYPAAELRAQRSGRVQVRVQIGPDGRVTGVSRVSATSNAFWTVTEQQARRWRFRPATVDGRPVADTKVLSLVFRIEDA